MGIRVLKGGLMTTIQDQGRTGFQRFGFVVGGAMDSWAMQLANTCLQNDPNEAVLEMTLVGANLEFEVKTEICFCGADMNPTINGQPVFNGKPYSIEKGDILTFQNATKGCRTYLAVKGGFRVEPVLGSKSTYMKAEIGKKLEDEDRIPIQKYDETDEKKWRLDPSLFSYLKSETVRFIEGRHYTSFAENRFESSIYQVETASDRMGYRFKGESIFLKEKREIITEGTAFGTIQIPSNGQPIVLMAERQPTGGYPKIGEVITADLPILAQRKPGDFVRFKKVSIAEAQKELIETHKMIKTFQAVIKERVK